MDDADVDDIALFAKNAGVELKRSRQVVGVGSSSRDDNDEGRKAGGTSKDGLSRDERRRKSRINKM